MGGEPELKLVLIFDYSACQSHGKILAGANSNVIDIPKNKPIAGVVTHTQTVGLRRSCLTELQT